MHADGPAVTAEKCCGQILSDASKYFRKMYCENCGDNRFKVKMK